LVGVYCGYSGGIYKGTSWIYIAKWYRGRAFSKGYTKPGLVYESLYYYSNRLLINSIIYNNIKSIKSKLNRKEDFKILDWLTLINYSP
jgi:hypothetical protein